MTHRLGLDHKAVIQAAAELADTEGLYMFSLATLATRLGIRPPTLYHYVDGLEGLQRELHLLGTQELARTLGRSIMGYSGSEAVKAMAVAYRNFAKAHPGLYNAVQRAAAPEDTALLEAEREVVEIVLRALAPLQLEHSEAIHKVRIIRSILHGFVSLEIQGGFGLPEQVDETFQHLVQVLIQVTKKADNYE